MSKPPSQRSKEYRDRINQGFSESTKHIGENQMTYTIEINVNELVNQVNAEIALLPNPTTEQRAKVVSTIAHQAIMTDRWIKPLIEEMTQAIGEI